KDQHNEAEVNAFFQVPDQPNIYVIGDNASSEHSPSGQLGGQQGEQVAAVLSDVLEGKTPKKPKPIRLRGSLGSLGKSDGLGHIFSQSLTGVLARITKAGALWLKQRH